MTATASGSGLRSRKVDPKRPMTVVRYDQVDDLDEASMIHRAIPQISTGVEKEEEEEHHLQAALVARSKVVIPTPDASNLIDLPNYDQYYTPTFHLPKTLIKFSTLVEEVVGCLYNFSEEDFEWFNGLDPGLNLSIEDCENTIYTLDLMGSEKVSIIDKVSGECPTLEECKSALENYPDVQKHGPEAIEAVYNYWKVKRYEKNKGHRVRYILKSEDMSANPDSDPYVCFRQREIKTFRKVRRSDTVALDKLRKLKEDMANCKHLLDMVYEREKVRKDHIDIEHLVFEKRVYMRRLRKHLGITTVDPLDNSPVARTWKRPRRYGDEEGSTKIRIPIASLRDAANLVTDMDANMFDESRFLSTDQKIEEKIKKEKALNEKSGWIDTTEVFLTNQFPFTPHPHSKLWSSFLGIEEPEEKRHYIHVSTRRRIGRGGRVIFDRHAHRPYNPSSYHSLLDPPDLPIEIIPSTEYYFINIVTQHI